MGALTTAAGAAALTNQLVNEASSATGITLEVISGQKLLNAAITFGVSLLVIFIVLKIVDHLQKLSPMDATLKSFIRSTVKACLWIIAIGAILAQLGVDTKNFAAIVSIFGLALSLSLQSTLSNLFAGMTILTTKPFIAGDSVKIGDAEGVIMQVELFYTTMLTADNKTIFIPNSQVTEAKILNYSRQKERRVDINLGLDYSTPTELAMRVMLETARADERVLEDPAPSAVISAYQDSSILFSLRVWVKTEDYSNTLFGLNASLREAFEKNGISITYNHLNVHILDEKKNGI
ncbi:MAG: mechanosensitive ion channel family protein [Oscillospiraceae bacterium]|jgi:small conductance mechanosensitive channel